MSDGRLADRRGLLRLERLAAAWGVVAALGYGLARSWGGALALTAAAAVGIVAFRGLQRIVSALGPSESPPAGLSERSDAPGAPGTHGNHGWRPGLKVLVRLALLGAAVAAAGLLLEPEHLPAIVLGFSALPAAFLIEALWQTVRASRRRGREDHEGS